MSQMALIGSPGFDLQGKSAAVARPAPLPGIWRVRQRDDSITALSWVVAIAASFLLIGIIGMFQKVEPFEISLGSRAGQGASDNESTELTMAELHAMEEAPEIATEQVLPAVVEIAQPLEVLEDLPELAETLTTEDVFSVPAAPRIEDALKPIDPAKPKPKPQAATPRPRASRAVTTAAGTPSGTQGNGGGSGGTLAAGSGSGKGVFPKPTYPSSAQARGISGRVTIALSVNPAGRVESASAISSQGGFTSSEQDAVARDVARTWRFPPGAYRKHTVNIVLKLSSR